MLDIDFISELPTDTLPLALFLYEERARLHRDRDGDSNARSQRTYMMEMQAFCEAYEIDPPLEELNRYVGNIGTGLETQLYNKALISIEHTLKKSQIFVAELKKRQRKSYPFDTAAKQKIREYVDSIKSVIDKLEITEAKRERLFGALNKFLNDVDKTGRSWKARAKSLRSLLGSQASGRERKLRKRFGSGLWSWSISSCRTNRSYSLRPQRSGSRISRRTYRTRRRQTMSRQKPTGETRRAFLSRIN